MFGTILQDCFLIWRVKWSSSRRSSWNTPLSKDHKIGDFWICDWDCNWGTQILGQRLQFLSCNCNSNVNLGLSVKHSNHLTHSAVVNFSCVIRNDQPDLNGWADICFGQTKFIESIKW